MTLLREEGATKEKKTKGNRKRGQEKHQGRSRELTINGHKSIIQIISEQGLRAFAKESA